MTEFYETREVAKDIWAINGSANDLMYLVIGSKKAMLVDTGMGFGDLAAEVRNLTDLPLMVVNTHGHPDHAGGNPNFIEVWLHPKDDRIMRVMCSDEYRQKDIQAATGKNENELRAVIGGMVHFKPVKIHALKQGQIIDLGNRTFEVLEVPGHTPGSICLLNADEKILMTGDAIVATPVWLYLDHSLPLKTYLNSLKKLSIRRDDFQLLFPGHQPTPISIDQLDDLIACAEEILSGVGVGEIAHTFAGVGYLWTHGKGMILYDPEKKL